MNTACRSGTRTGRLLAAAAMLALPVGALAFPDNPEVEPNETKAQATIAASGGAGMAPGDTISGTTTGTSTTVGGVASADTFRVRTAAAPLGIYRNDLVLTSAVVGHSGNILGLSQATGVPQQGTDFSFQFSYTQADTSRLNRWYGFGRREEVYYRVTGTTTTTAPYSAAYSSTAVTPTIVADTIVAGSITLDTAGSSSDTELWVYDDQLSAIPGWGDDDTPGVGLTSRTTRTFPAGTYYIAVGNFNMGNNLGSPPDDNYRVGTVLDFPNAIADSVATTAAVTINLSIAHSGGTSTTSVTRSIPFEIAWVRMTVSPTSDLLGVGMATPYPVMQGNAALISVYMPPAINPASTGRTVTVDLSPIGGSASQTLFDNGTNGDPAANDSHYSFSYTVPNSVAAGVYTLNWTGSDAQARSASGTIEVTVVTPPPLSGTGAVSPATVSPGNSVLFTVHATPAGSPTSTGIAITADLSQVGGSATQTLFDNGTNGDVTAGDLTFSFNYTIPAATAGGSYTMTWSASDAQGRTATGSFPALAVAAPPNATDLGTLSGSHTPIVTTGTLGAAQIFWYKFRTLVPASPTVYYDFTTMGSNLNAPDDTEIGLFDSNGTLVGTNDDSGTGAVSPYLNYLSLLSYGQTAPARTYTSPPTMSTQTATGQNGATLPAGLYYMALAGFNSTFANGWLVTSTSTYTGDFRLALYTNPGPAGCNLADITGIGGPPAVPDGLLTGDDFNSFIAAFAANNLLADVTGIGGPPAIPDGLITGDDFNAFIAAFAAGCP